MNNNEISNAYIGSTKVDKIYLGEKLIFPNTPSVLDYNGVVQVDNVGDFDVLSPDDRYRYNIQVDNVGDFDVTVINNNITNTSK